MSACDSACVRACAHSILYALYAIVSALPRFRREGLLEYLNLRVCVCVCVRAFMCASVRQCLNLNRNVNEVGGLTRPKREAYERTYCTPRPISGGFVGRSATTGCSTAASEMRSPAASALALPEGPPRRGDERAPIHCPEGDHAGLSRQAAPHCASGTKAAQPRPKRESVRFPQPMDGLSKCSAQFAERCLGVLAQLRTSAGRPTGSIDCTARASTPQCAPPPAADHRSDVGCSREGAANTYTNRSARLARVGSTCVRPLHPHAVHRAAQAGATRIEHAWSDQHCEATKPPFSQADRAWREIALLPQARHGHDATRVAAHWKRGAKLETRVRCGETS